jgi:hypothetical protein
VTSGENKELRQDPVCEEIDQREGRFKHNLEEHKEEERKE